MLQPKCFTIHSDLCFKEKLTEYIIVPSRDYRNGFKHQYNQTILNINIEPYINHLQVKEHLNMAKKLFSNENKSDQ